MQRVGCLDCLLTLDISNGRIDHQMDIDLMQHTAKVATALHRAYLYATVVLYAREGDSFKHIRLSECIDRLVDKAHDRVTVQWSQHIQWKSFLMGESDERPREKLEKEADNY